MQRPRGAPVATVAIDGGRNAGILAARILALADADLRERIEAALQAMSAAARESDERLRDA